MNNMYESMTTEELRALLETKRNDSAIFQTKQMAFKIVLNSAYGAIGNEYFRFFSLDLAEAITLSGQLSIRWIEKRVNRYLNEICETEGVDYTICSDTDSIYLTLSGLVRKVGLEGCTDKTKVVDFLDRAGKKINQYIDQQYAELSEYMNAYEQKMIMKREIIADAGFWIAKKRYAVNVYDSEGTRFAEPHLKIMGLENVRSSTPAPCREAIEETIRLILTATEQDVRVFIEGFRKKFESLSPEEIAFPRGVSDLVKYKDSGRGIYIKGTPMHVRGCLLYNHWITQKGLQNKYEMIRNGDKIKFVYLRSPNPIRDNTISFVSELPRELKLHDHIDYATQFNKTYEEPILNILKTIGWRMKETNAVEDLFV